MMAGRGSPGKSLILEAHQGTKDVQGQEPSRREKQATPTFHATPRAAPRRVRGFSGQMQLCRKAKERKAGMEKINRFMTALVNETHCSRDAGEEFVPPCPSAFLARGVFLERVLWAAVTCRQRDPASVCLLGGGSGEGLLRGGLGGRKQQIRQVLFLLC